MGINNNYVPAGLSSDQVVATFSSTSWYDKKGNLQVRTYILPIKNDKVKDKLRLTLIDQGQESWPKLAEHELLIPLDGKAQCARATVEDRVNLPDFVKSPAALLMWDSNYETHWSYRVPFPDTTRHVQGRKSRYIGEEFTALTTNELSHLAKAALKKEITTEPEHK